MSQLEPVPPVAIAAAIPSSRDRFIVTFDSDCDTGLTPTVGASMPITIGGDTFYAEYAEWQDARHLVGQNTDMLPQHAAASLSYLGGDTLLRGANGLLVQPFTLAVPNP